MSLDDELRKRMQQAADRAGHGIDPSTLARAATSRATGGGMKQTLLGGLGVAGLVAGGVLGFTALAPSDDGNAGSVGATVDVSQYSLYDCPNGALSGQARPGDRVYVVGRDDSGEWLEIRDPRNQAVLRWLPAAAVDPDNVIDVPVHECSRPIEMVAGDGSTPTTGPTDTTAPAANVPPVIAQAAASPSVIKGPGTCGTSTSTVSVVVTDAGGVASVRVNWSLTAEIPPGSTQSGTVNLTRAGTTWSGNITVGENPVGADTYMTLTFVATDAQGLTTNLSANNVLLVEYCLG